MENIISLLNENKLVLKNCDEEEQNKYLLEIYKSILLYLYSINDLVALKLKDFGDEFVEIENKENEKILKEIREDILNEVKKEINFFLFGDVDI